MTAEIDRLNLEALGMLQEDGRRSYADIAEDLDRAESTVRDRIHRLEELGVIQRYTAVLDASNIGLTGRALVRARVPGDRLQEAFDGLLSVPEVTNVHHVTGRRNVGIAVTGGDVGSLQGILRRLSEAADLHQIKTDVVLRTVTRSRPLPLTKILHEDGEGVAPWEREL